MSSSSLLLASAFAASFRSLDVRVHWFDCSASKYEMVAVYGVFSSWLMVAKKSDL